MRGTAELAFLFGLKEEGSAIFHVVFGEASFTPETQKCTRSVLKSRRRLDEIGSSVRRKRLYCVPRRRLDETGLIGRSVSSLSEVKENNLLLSEKKKTEERGRKNDDYIADRFDRDRAKVTKRVVFQQSGTRFNHC